MLAKIGIGALLLYFSISTSAATELALNWKAEPEFGGFYAAIQVLQKQGLELKIIEGGSGTPTIQMLAAQQIPYAIVSADELITARERGMDLVAVFAVYQIDPQGIMVHEESPWKTLKDLLNDPEATLAVQMGLPYVAYLKKKFPEMKAKLVPYQGGVSVFLAQKNYAQQCFITAEPLAAEKAGAKTRNFTLDAVGFNPYLAVVAVQGETLRKKKAEVAKVIAGFREGWENYLSKPAETDKMMNKLNPSMSMETFAAAGKAQINLIKPQKDFKVGTMTTERWKTLSLQLQDLHLIKQVQAPTNYFENF